MVETRRVVVWAGDGVVGVAVGGEGVSWAGE